MIGCKLVLITDRKSHMSLQLAPKLVTLNDLKQPLLCIISPILVAFGADYVKVVEDTPIVSRTKM